MIIFQVQQSCTQGAGLVSTSIYLAIKLAFLVRGSWPPVVCVYIIHLSLDGFLPSAVTHSIRRSRDVTLGTPDILSDHPHRSNILTPPSYLALTGRKSYPALLLLWHEVPHPAMGLLQAVSL